MKTKFFLIMSLVLLAGCSEEVEQTDEEQVKVEQQQADIKDDSAEADVSEKTDATRAEDEEADKEVSNAPTIDMQTDTATESQEHGTTTTKTVTETAELTEDTNYYTYYQSQGTVKTEDSPTTSSSKDIPVYEQMTEGVIELPKLENNEGIFGDRVETLTLQDLEAIEAVRYMEEPATLGNLIIIDLKLLKAQYLGKSYSLVFDDMEYGMVISEEDEHLGVILMRDTKGLIDDIKETAVFNIMK